MTRLRTWTIVLSALAAALWPSVALAQSSAESMDPFNISIGALSLIAAIFLLIVVLGLRRVAEGSAVADNIAFVMAGTLALAASVVAAWANRFMVGISGEQTRIAADLLVMLSMVLFAVYFWRVRSALARFLSVNTEELLAEMQYSDERSESNSTAHPDADA